jgi:hypothetical protein
MDALLGVIAAMGQVLGSLAAAGLLCWLLWQIFAQVRHPDWAAAMILILIALAVTGNLPNSQFLNLVLAYAVLAVVPFWIAGRTWRREHPRMGSKPHAGGSR